MLDYCEVHGSVAILAPVSLLWYSRFRWILCSNIQLSSSHLLLFAIFSLCSSHHTPQTLIFYNIWNQGFWFLKSWSSNALCQSFSVFVDWFFVGGQWSGFSFSVYLFLSFFFARNSLFFSSFCWVLWRKGCQLIKGCFRSSYLRITLRLFLMRLRNE